jgi:hypothetical protein
MTIFLFGSFGFNPTIRQSIYADHCCIKMTVQHLEKAVFKVRLFDV